MSVINRDEAIFSLGMKLRQVGRMQISRILGSVSNANGAYKALIDLLERSYFMRAEINALTKLLIDKGMLTQSDWQKRIEEEFRSYLGEVAKDWPEIEFQDNGFVIKDAEALAKRAQREGWPP